MTRTLQNPFIGAFAAFFLILFAATSALAQGFSTQARHAILIDAGTGEVLFEKDPDSLMPPASMSKLMTMVMVFEALKGNQLTLNDG